VSPGRHARACIGTSGWNYDGWRESFYRGVRREDWLRFCAERFTGIEVNATFYRLQTHATFERWRAATPRDFRFAIKANRFLTHNKKLADPRRPIALERNRAAGLGRKLAAVVWQLPHGFHRNLERLEDFARALGAWRTVRHAIEFRHESWFDDEVAGCLRRHRLAVCQSDAANWPLWDAVTTDFVYARLHGHTATYASAYPEAALRGWAARVRRWLAEGREVHVYFDNDAVGHAPRDAARLIGLVDVEAAARARRAAGQRSSSAPSSASRFSNRRSISLSAATQSSSSAPGANPRRSAR
jgi:uncharacterized protein YecE (DUF72 family)